MLWDVTTPFQFSIPYKNKNNMVVTQYSDGTRLLVSFILDTEPADSETDTLKNTVFICRS